MYLTINFNNQNSPITEKIYNKLPNGVLPSKFKACEFFVSELFSKNFFGLRHFFSQVISKSQNFWFCYQGMVNIPAKGGQSVRPIHLIGQGVFLFAFE